MALGRVEHPCSTAADQGWSALPRNIFGSQVSALGSLVRVIRYRCGYGQYSGPEPVPEPEHLNLAPGCRDPRPENVFPSANHPVPLGCYLSPATRHLRLPPATRSQFFVHCSFLSSITSVRAGLPVACVGRVSVSSGSWNGVRRCVRGRISRRTSTPSPGASPRRALRSRN